MRASSTVAANTPTIPTVQLRGSTPECERHPNVGFRPTTPHNAAGMRTDPPPSTPRVAGHNPADTAAADPLDEPPEIIWLL
eukprot:Gb_08293 [translate_table: standard]